MSVYENSQKEIKKIIYGMTGKYSAYDIFMDFLTIAACTISNSVDKQQWQAREDKYMQVIKKYTKDEADNFAKIFAQMSIGLEHELGDYLGELYMTMELGSKHTGQFFTPFHVSKLMGELLYDIEEVKKKKTIPINDPACGSSGLIIAYADNLKKNDINYQEKLRVFVSDIDYNAVKMSYIQLSLLGIDAVVYQKNALAPLDEPPGEVWYTPMHFINLVREKQRIEADEKSTKMYEAMQKIMQIEKPTEQEAEVIPGQMDIFDFV